MGLVEGTRIVELTELAEITHEPNFANLDDDASATALNACKWATSWLIDELDARGIPVAQISNPERLKRAAAFYAAFRILNGGEPGDDAAKERAAGYLAEAKQLVVKYRFVPIATDGSVETNLRLPELGNQDLDATFGEVPPYGRRPGYGPMP